ncbi:hypothetical protein [Geminocystis sp. GBBB08]|nr:hypothetical protein [Geminocystis sp. GBBB08]
MVKVEKRKKLTNSPFRYPGGKFYARKLILTYAKDIIIEGDFNSFLR